MEKKRKGGCMVGRRLLLENVVIKVVAFFHELLGSLNNNDGDGCEHVT